MSRTVWSASFAGSPESIAVPVSPLGHSSCSQHEPNDTGRQLGMTVAIAWAMRGRLTLYRGCWQVGLEVPHLSTGVGQGGRLLNGALVEDIVECQFLEVKSIRCEDLVVNYTDALCVSLVDFWSSDRPACKPEAL